MAKRKLGRRQFVAATAATAGVAAVASCAGPGSAPTPTTAAIKPGESIGTKGEMAVPKEAPAPAPTATTVAAPTAVPPTATPVPAKPVVVAAPTPTQVPAVVKGTGGLPTPRDQTYINWRGNATVFDNFNIMLEAVNAPTYHFGVVQGLFEYPFYANYASGEVEPWQALKWAYNGEYTKCTFNLRKGMKWADGKPVTAHDWAFTTQMWMSNEKFRGQASLISDIKEVRAIDEEIIEYTLKKPLPRFHMRAWASPIASGLMILPKHVWDGKDPSSFKNYPPVGSGPFKLKDVYQDQKMFVWERRDDYWWNDRYNPAMKYAIYMTGPTAEAAYAAMAKDETDTAGLDFQLAEKLVKENQNWEMSIFQDPCPRAVMFNCEKVKDPVVRWAIQYCTNSEKLAATVWQPPTTRATSPWARYAFMEKWFDKEILEKKYRLEFNPQKAIDTLEKAGYVRGPDGIRAKGGVKLQYTATTPAAVGQGEHAILTDIAEECKKIGIDVTVKRFEFPVFQEGWLKGEPDLVAFWWCGPVPNVLGTYVPFQSKFFKPVGEASMWDNYPARMRDPEFDKAVEAFEAVTPDAPNAQELHSKCLELLMKNLPAYPVVETQYFKLFNNRYWTGYPNKGKFYTPPADWWGTFRLVLYNLKKKGQ